MKSIVLTVMLIACAGWSPATVRNVPASYPTIQAAINASVDGDTVLVAPGTFTENIVFRGKNIVVTSRFALNSDPTYIQSTIINGGSPAFVDSGSCVRIVNGEDSTAVLQGFTLTGGHGTLWEDEHGRPNRYWEGGGVLIALSSPTVRNNIIRNNNVNRSGGRSAGGGGIRLGDGSPRISNNVVINNAGMYGGGIVSNYASPIIRNNIVTLNVESPAVPGLPTFGGGGLWFNGTLAGALIENNTIVGNVAEDGGGIEAPSELVNLRNNIVWGNVAPSNSQVNFQGGSATVTSSDIQGGWTGTGNIDQYPLFADSGMILLDSSPCVDAGDASPIYNDPSDPINPTNAKWPSKGGLRNDMGAYGGPGRSVLPVFSNAGFVSSPVSINFGTVQVDSSSRLTVALTNLGTRPFVIDSIRFVANAGGHIIVQSVIPTHIDALSADTIALRWTPGTVEVLRDTLQIFHREASLVNPQLIPLTGRAFAIAPAQAGVMYATSGTFDSGRLLTINPVSGAATPVGPSGYAQIVSACVHPVSHTLLGLVPSGSATIIVRINTGGGDAYPVSSVSLNSLKGMAFRGDTLYVARITGGLYKVDIATGLATLVATSAGINFSGLAFSPITGQLWASVRAPSANPDRIYKIDLPSGTPTLVGSTGQGQTSDIIFDGRGRLFGVIGTGSAINSLISIDTSTGVGTVIGPTGISSVQALAVRPDSFVTGVGETVQRILPSETGLEQNYPNPFNPITTITYQLSTRSDVSLKVYDLLGREVATLVEGAMQPGSYTSTWNAGNSASGVYIYRLIAGEHSIIKKLILMK